MLLVDATHEILQAVPAALTGRIASIGVGSPHVPSFDIDNARCTTAMARYLHASGRRRIAMISGPSWLPCTPRRVHALHATMRAAGLPVRIVPGDFTASSGSTATLAALHRWPDTDAVLAGSDAMALGALTTLRQHHRSVPADVAVAGFDDIPFAALNTPALTTASHPVERIASDAATAILDGRRTQPTTVYPSTLIPRESA